MKASIAVALVASVLAGAHGPVLAERGQDHLEEANLILEDINAGKVEDVNKALDHGLAHLCAEMAELRAMQVRAKRAVSPPSEACRAH